MQTHNTLNTSDDADDHTLVGVPSHPIAAVVGAIAAGGATGAVVGTAAGPVGTVVGAVVGAVAGALGGDAIASSFDQAEDAHWRESFSSRPYFTPGRSYEDYRPAYALGYGVRRRNGHSTFEEADTELANQWAKSRGDSGLDWPDARQAARDAWNRADEKAYENNS